MRKIFKILLVVFLVTVYFTIGSEGALLAIWFVILLFLFRNPKKNTKKKK